MIRGTLLPIFLVSVLAVSGWLLAAAVAPLVAEWIVNADEIDDVAWVQHFAEHYHIH